MKTLLLLLTCLALTGPSAAMAGNLAGDPQPVGAAAKVVNAHGKIVDYANADGLPVSLAGTSAIVAKVGSDLAFEQTRVLYEGPSCNGQPYLLIMFEADVAGIPVGYDVNGVLHIADRGRQTSIAARSSAYLGECLAGKVREYPVYPLVPPGRIATQFQVADQFVADAQK